MKWFCAFSHFSRFSRKILRALLHFHKVFKTFQEFWKTLEDNKAKNNAELGIEESHMLQDVTRRNNDFCSKTFCCRFEFWNYETGLEKVVWFQRKFQVNYWIVYGVKAQLLSFPKSEPSYSPNNCSPKLHV